MLCRASTAALVGRIGRDDEAQLSPTRNTQGAPLLSGRHDDAGDEPFNWSVLVPHILHPMKVVVVEALHYIGQPLSATDLSKMFDEEVSLANIAYHVKRLAGAGILIKVGEREVRGSMEKFYVCPPQD